MEFPQLEITNEFYSSILLIVLYAVIFIISKWIKDLVSPFSMNKQLTDEDNVSLAISVGGYAIGWTLIFISAATGPHISIFMDLLLVGGYSLGGIIFLNVSRIINDRFIFKNFRMASLIIKEQNESAGVVQAASYIASGLIIGGSVHGEDGGPLHALIFFILGQLVLVLFGLFYEKVIKYDAEKEIMNNNLAAAFAFAGGLIAIGIIIMRAVSGTFTTWSESLILLVIDVSIVFVYFIIVRFYFDKLIIPKSDLNKEIVEDKNVGAGVLEMITSVCFAIILFFIL